MKAIYKIGGILTILLIIGAAFVVGYNIGLSEITTAELNKYCEGSGFDVCCEWCNIVNPEKIEDWLPDEA